jgi:hypothetical protein
VQARCSDVVPGFTMPVRLVKRLRGLLEPEEIADLGKEEIGRPAQRARAARFVSAKLVTVTEVHDGPW